MEQPVCELLGLGGEERTKFETGSLPVYAVGNKHVLKLYPPEDFDETAVESAALRAVEGRLPVPTPAVEAVGELDGWGYILMRRLWGEPLSTVWPTLAPQDRAGVAAQLGEALAALHALPTVDDLGPADWDQFITTQRLGCVEQQRAHGLPQEWLAQIPDFLDSVELESPSPVLLHTEVMGDHLLVTPGTHGWRLSGLFDFEPAMNGAPEYEFVSVGLFVTRGDPAALRQLLTAYGRSPDASWPARILAYTLLHVYSNLPWFLDELPAPGAATLPELAERWFLV